MTSDLQPMSYDVAVLGGGPGGYAAALRAAQRGAKVCLIEAGRLGGTCLNVGCIPTKAMLHASDLYWQMNHAESMGFVGPAAALDGRVFMRRVTTTVDKIVAGLAGLIKARKIEVIAGYGRLVGRNQLAVTPASGGAVIAVQAKSIILACGSSPGRPPVFDFSSPRVLTTDQATTCADLPKSVLIIGGGVIGCEFATMYSELGIRTVVIEMLDTLLSGLDADAARAVARSLQARGVEVRTGCKVLGTRETSDGIVAQLEDGQTVQAQVCLVAVGRKPNLDVGLDAAGVEVRDGLVAVDDRCRTNIDGIYAVGDMAVRMQYAHLASRMGMVAADNATGHEASDDRTVVPVGVYTHPEIASVGLTSAQAEEAGKKVRTARFPYLASGMAQAYGRTEGMVKLTGDASSGELLGALVIGEHATDVIQELAMAMRHKLSIEQVAATIHPHPTFVEAVGEAAESFLGLPLHILR